MPEGHLKPRAVDFRGPKSDPSQDHMWESSDTEQRAHISLYQVWLKSHMKGRAMLSSASPGVPNPGLISNTITGKCVHFLNYISLILEEMSSRGCTLKAKFRCWHLSATLLLRTLSLFLHLVIKVRNLGQSPVPFLLILSLKPWGSAPWVPQSVPLHVTRSEVWAFSVSPRLSQGPVALSSVAPAPVHSSCWDQTQRIKFKSNMPAFLAKI